LYPSADTGAHELFGVIMKGYAGLGGLS
jgi:hypothetical protein